MLLSEKTLNECRVRSLPAWAVMPLLPGLVSFQSQNSRMKVLASICLFFLFSTVNGEGEEESFATGPPGSEEVFIGTTPPTLSPVTESTVLETFEPTVSIPPEQSILEVTPCQLCSSGYTVDTDASAFVNDVQYPCQSLPINLGQTPLCDVFRRHVESVCCVSLMDTGTQTTLEQETSAVHAYAPIWGFPIAAATFLVSLWS